MLPKFESQQGEDWSPHDYPKVFAREQTTGPERLKIAASYAGTDTLLQLAAVLSEPFVALYVLTVPRGGGTEGRYQSPWMDRRGLTALVENLSECLEQDGRHNFWNHSEPYRAEKGSRRKGVRSIILNDSTPRHANSRLCS